MPTYVISEETAAMIVHDMSQDELMAAMMYMSARISESTFWKCINSSGYPGRKGLPDFGSRNGPTHENFVTVKSENDENGPR